MGKVILVTTHVYKVCTIVEAQEFVVRFLGSAADLRDGYIHLSTGEQLGETLRRHYGAVDRVVIYTVDLDRLDPSLVKWEPSRGGDLFPHYYAPLPRAAVVVAYTIERGPDGSFPWSLESTAP